MSKLKNIRYSKKSLEKLLIYPDKNANKYSRGTCYVVAGSKKFPGAAVLCASAANRYGAGYTKLFTCAENVRASAFTMPSCVCAAVEDLEIPSFLDVEKPHAFVVGPGFVPNDTKSNNLICKILKNAEAPVVLDGGALSTQSLKKGRDLIAHRANNKIATILTPHMGEAAKIIANYGEDFALSPETLAAKLAELSMATIVLKGPNTYVCDNQKIYVMKQGTAALAKAGSGDVLAGILGALLCQNKIDVFKACVLATNLHAQAGIFAAKELGEPFVIPEDLFS